MGLGACRRETWLKAEDGLMPERIDECLVLVAVRGALSHTKRPHTVDRCLVLCKICAMTRPLVLLVVMLLPVLARSIGYGNFSISKSSPD